MLCCAVQKRSGTWAVVGSCSITTHSAHVWAQGAAMHTYGPDLSTSVIAAWSVPLKASTTMKVKSGSCLVIPQNRSSGASGKAATRGAHVCLCRGKYKIKVDIDRHLGDQHLTTEENRENPLQKPDYESPGNCNNCLCIF